MVRFDGNYNRLEAIRAPRGFMDTVLYSPRTTEQMLERERMTASPDAVDETALEYLPVFEYPHFLDGVPPEGTSESQHFSLVEVLEHGAGGPLALRIDGEFCDLAQASNMASELVELAVTYACTDRIYADLIFSQPKTVKIALLKEHDVARYIFTEARDPKVREDIQYLIGTISELDRSAILNLRGVREGLSRFATNSVGVATGKTARPYRPIRLYGSDDRTPALDAA